MKNIKILDCTLRDGGRIIDCKFHDDEIKNIADNLADAKIDIIELGFLRDWRKVNYQGNSTFFTSVEQMKPFVDTNRKNTMYVAFIDYGMFDIDSLTPCDNSSITGIRLGFTKKDYVSDKVGIVSWANKIKSMGYKIFIQGVNSLNYSDKEFLEIIDMINELHPYSFGLVDTYGAMYIDDVDRFFGLIDRNMHNDICLDFHSHNNYQLSFALAQEVIKLSSNGTRKVIIDATLGGMGKVAGNLNTELIIEYLVRKKQYDYEQDILLDTYDDFIYKYTLDNSWGYSIPALMAGIYKSHPNNVIYLTKKFRLASKDIGRILSMIDPVSRQRYDYDAIEKLYVEYSSVNVDDSATLEKLKAIIGDKEVVVMVPGISLTTQKDLIDSYISSNNVFVISVNFVAENPSCYAFFGNPKRYNNLKEKRRNRNVIISSNVQSDNQKDLVINYNTLIDRNYNYFDNSTMMLLRLLKRIEVINITFAGFDGFTKDLANNYFDDSFQNDRHKYEFDALNDELNLMLEEYIKVTSPKCKFKFITSSKFEGVLKNIQ